MSTNPQCSNCKWWGALLAIREPGICYEQWRRLEWNGAVPLTASHYVCDEHQSRLTSAQQEK